MKVPGHGQTTVRLGKHFQLHPVVFPAAAVVIVALVLITLGFPADSVRDAFSAVRDTVGNQFGWLYVATMNAWLVLAVYLAVGRFGHIRLGRDDDRPEFSRLTWFAMLFSAGMGIGLVFWSVAEPIAHFTTPPPGYDGAFLPSKIAMATTIFHWGLHPWALYAFVALALAYFGFRHPMPLSFRSLLSPVFGRHVNGFFGYLVDVTAIVATLIGVATSLGIGAQQINAGLAFLFDVPIQANIQVVLIACITCVATVSVVLGLGTGIRRLSELNLFLAAVLMLMVVFGFGVPAFLRGLIDNIGGYLQILPTSAFRSGGFSPQGQAWLNDWTVFYWAWWISWSPFVGMFIARVSRGRTIREFVIGVLLVPTAVGIAWLTAFGNTTLLQHTRHLRAVADETVDAVDKPTYNVAVLDDAGRPISSDDGTFRVRRESLTAVQYRNATIISEDGRTEIATLPTVMFAMLSELFPNPWTATVAIGIATLCIVLFFVTSSDSASMVIDIIASGGNPNPPVGTRLFWAIAEGVVAATLLLTGGLRALQAAAIAAALPMTFILILASIGLVRALHAETDPQASSEK